MSAIQEKTVLCASCDIACQLRAEVQEGRVTRIKGHPNPLLRDNICMKGIYAPKGFAHPDRVLHPLKRKGERGSGEWQRVSWDDAMGEIAERLQAVVDEHGPEALAVSTSQWNTSTESGAGRRFLNALGSPNWISGVALCAGNTAAVNRMVYGWFPFPDFAGTNCIVLFGHNPKRHSWTPIYNGIRKAQQRGAKLIVLDPRKSESAERADIWLPLKAGTDAAMCFGWMKVILDEGLYDHEFVRDWTVGFEAFKERVDQFPLSRVAEITGCEPEQIAAAARMYATNGPSVIPWTPITDQQRNSTSAIRLHASLRAVCGYLDVPGGEQLNGFNPDVIPESEMEAHGLLSGDQKAKQLGSDKHPVFTYRGTAALAEPTKRVWGHEYANIVMGSYMANPSAVFRAMADGDPYPVKAFIVLGNNTLMSYANMQLIHRGMMNQDLIVAHEHMKTPTAQLADFILPGDSWLERSHMMDGFGWTNVIRTSDQAMEPPGECRGVYEFWRDLAHRMGLGEHFPWATVEELYTHRLQATGMDWQTFLDTYEIYLPEPAYRKYEKTGFATPSGKVELESSILEDLGFDPLPYYREEPPADPDFPIQLFMGVREDEFFQTGQRFIPELRNRKPEPQMYIHRADAAEHGLEEGDWVDVETKNGKVRLQTLIRKDMPKGLIRVPHGWWKPEATQGEGQLSGAWLHADAQICPDDDDFLDREQGIPHFKGVPARITKVEGSA
ncbi:MAG: molybdopterin-dependent oxidoreductase [Myxococcota bacterium]|nr:molybdopterin-dependent oxidoreductase [Myxococcota bacterium]